MRGTGEGRPGGDAYRTASLSKIFLSLKYLPRDDIRNIDNKFRHWLKNDNTAEQPHTIWRYQHFASATPFQQKRAVIMACMQKVQRMASAKEAIYDSAVQKMAEFPRLEYPISVLRGVCTYMAATTAEYEWINVRATISMAT